MITFIEKIRKFKENLPKALLFLVDEKDLPAGAAEVYLLASNGIEILCFDVDGVLHRVNLQKIKKISPQRSEHVLVRYDRDMTKIIWKKMDLEAEEMSFEPITYTGTATLDLDVIIKQLNINPVNGIEPTRQGRKAQNYTYDNLDILEDSLLM